MVVEYTRYRIDKERHTAFLQAYRDAQQFLQASPNCIAYEMTHCGKEPERFILRIEWISTERHLHGFRQEDNFKKFFALVQPFVANIEEMQHYELTPIVGSGGGRGQASVA
ncbi:MAG: antibiotic biosynthesis monooxygenase [Acidobacteria bacterium]|nr:antibiotic biosynthesis monooxygenase [Acidobacteriota bacterium]